MSHIIKLDFSFKDPKEYVNSMTDKLLDRGMLISHAYEFISMILDEHIETLNEIASETKYHKSVTKRQQFYVNARNYLMSKF